MFCSRSEDLKWYSVTILEYRDVKRRSNEQGKDYSYWSISVFNCTYN